MLVELIAAGTELLRLGRRDTNSEWLTNRLQAAGVEVGVRCAVDDDIEHLASVVASALARADIVVITGGLGPTEDDRTREAVARALGVPLERDPEREEQLRRLYERHGRRCGDAEARQAMRPVGAGWIDNPLGSAAGLRIEQGGRMLAALPGVPAEMRAMFEADVLPRVARRIRGNLGRRALRIVGRTEGALERTLGDLYAARGLDVTVLGGLEGIELHASARGRDREEVEQRLRSFESEVRARLGRDVVGSVDDRLAAVVGSLLSRAGLRVATAESCTAGLLAGALTSVPGSSSWFRGGLVVYADELKRTLAGVRAESLAAHGAVSEPVARELARGARERCAADIGVGVTGIAGPGGGTQDKPVGRVHLAISHGADELHEMLRLLGDRETVRRRTVTVALDRLRRLLLDGP